jgi:streptogrisin C
MEQVLESTFPDTWAGLWVEHQPYRIVIAATDFTGIRSVLSHFDVPAPVEFQYADLTLQQLIDAHQRLRAVLNHETARSEIDIHRNQLVVYALVGTEYNATLSAIGIPADHIQVQILSAFPKLTTTIYGGGTVSTCTSGFSVKKTISGSVWKGVTTAGHCSNSLQWTQSGETLVFRGEHNTQFDDSQWHTLPGQPNAAVNRVYTGQASGNPPYFQTITNYKMKSQLNIDSWYCKYGKNTGYGCGQLKSKYSDLCSAISDALYFENFNQDLAEIGDSGGPWFDNSYAVGTISCGGGGTSYAVDAYTMLVGLQVSLL